MDGALTPAGKPLAEMTAPELWWALVGAITQARAAGLRADMMHELDRDAEAEIASRDEDEATGRVIAVLSALQDRGELEAACLRAEAAEVAA